MVLMKVQKVEFWIRKIFDLLFSWKVQPEEIRYQSICQQLANLPDESIKKSSSNKLFVDEIQVRNLHAIISLSNLPSKHKTK
jgi:hypothetical protein